MRFLDRFSAPVGRAMLALLFVTAGLTFFSKSYFGFARSVIGSYGLPFPGEWLSLTMVLEIGCGALLLIRRAAPYAAAALFLWMIPATLMFHPFWIATPDQVPDQLFHFLKNVGIAGGLLCLRAQDRIFKAFNDRNETFSQ
jgi:putative oxidoreductase